MTIIIIQRGRVQKAKAFSSDKKSALERWNKKTPGFPGVFIRKIQKTVGVSFKKRQRLQRRSKGHLS
jgi:hypothetical protein